VMDGTAFAFEAMQWDDVPVVMGIEQRAFTLPWSVNTYRHELLENKHAHYYVVRYRTGQALVRRLWRVPWRRRPPGTPIVGYGGFWMITDEAHISTIAIDEAWRGRGLGEYLLASMIGQAAALDASRITLEVRETNQVAQNLYRKYGFEVSGKRLRYYQDNNETAILMIAYGVNTETYQAKFRALTTAARARLTRLEPSMLPRPTAS